MTILTTFGHVEFASPPPSDQWGRPAFRGVAYSGGIVTGVHPSGAVAVNLATLATPDGTEVPVLVNHDNRIDSCAGAGVLMRETAADGTVALVIRGKLTRGTPGGDQVANLFADRIPVQMSIGLRGDFVATKAKLTRINGRSLAIAGTFERGEVFEVSFVPLGADANTSAEQIAAARRSVRGAEQARLESLMAAAARLCAPAGSPPPVPPGLSPRGLALMAAARKLTGH